MTTKTEGWDEVATAVLNATLAYSNLLESRAKNRDGTKKAKAFETQWETAMQARYDALMRAWVEKDGLTPEGFKSVAAVLRRYYAETTIPRKGRR